MKIDILQAAFFTPMAGGDWGVPLLLWGAPGTVKTGSIRALGQRFGLHVERLAPGARGEGAFGVTPIPVTTEHGTVLTYPPADYASKLANGGILFIDELNTLPPALQPAGLDAVQEKTIGSMRFGHRVRVLGAANPIGQAAAGWDIAASQANRLGHIDWSSPETDEWAAYMLAGGAFDEKVQDAEKEEKRVMARWGEEYAKSVGLITAFLRRRPELLHKMPNDGDPAQSRAWPSPRTWEYTTRARAAGIIQNLSPTSLDEFTGAFIGNGANGELSTFIEEADLPDPAAVLDGKEHFTHEPARLDRTVAVLSACAALVTPPKSEKRKERTANLWQLLGAVAEDAKDIVIPPMTALVTAGLSAGTGPHRAIMAKVHGVVTASGVSGRDT